MNRQTFLRRSALAFAGSCVGPELLAMIGEGPVPRTLLSEHGCGRATGYSEANKIITSHGRTHMTWLDSEQGGFVVKARTYWHQRREWSPTYRVGEGYDNHGGPALTIDSMGFLHICYYPHHHAMRYRRSKRPHDASEWEGEVRFGQSSSYPTLICGPDDTLYCTMRRSFDGRPWQVELWRKPLGGPWIGPSPILRSMYPGYAHFQESLAWSPLDGSLHLACRFHEKTDDNGYSRLQTLCYMKSHDQGERWLQSDGHPVDLPGTADDLSVLASGGLDRGIVLRSGGIAVDALGRAYLIYAQERQGRSEVMLAEGRSDGGWTKQPLNQFLPRRYRRWQTLLPGSISYSADKRLHIALQIRPPSEEPAWGHPSNEVLLLSSRGGIASFQARVLSETDTSAANWLPNIERGTGHNGVPDNPTVIYTSGPPGTGLSRLGWRRGRNRQN